MDAIYDPETARLELELDPQVWEQLLAMYRDTLQEKMLGIHQAWGRPDRQGLGPLVHSLKGVSLSLAVHSVVRACGELEEALRSQANPEAAYQDLCGAAGEVEKVLFH